MDLKGIDKVANFIDLVPGDLFALIGRVFNRDGTLCVKAQSEGTYGFVVLDCPGGPEAFGESLILRDGGVLPFRNASIVPDLKSIRRGVVGDATCGSIAITPFGSELILQGRKVFQIDDASVRMSRDHTSALIISSWHIAQQFGGDSLGILFEP